MRVKIAFKGWVSANKYLAFCVDADTELSNITTDDIDLVEVKASNIRVDEMGSDRGYKKLMDVFVDSDTILVRFNYKPEHIGVRTYPAFSKEISQIDIVGWMRYPRYQGAV